MNLTEKPESMNWPETHYVFVERVGPFMENAGQAWQTAHSLAPALAEQNQVIGCMSLYRRDAQVYRAGFMLGRAPVNLPSGFTYEKFPGGMYRRFVLTGPYSQLPEASGRVWAIVEEEGIRLREGFAIENYVNSPQATPEEDLITEILVPTAE
jgi:predicted transcriptional regulator YdeE